MAAIFSQILNMSLTGSVVILLVMLARLILKRTPKIFSYALWSVVLFRLLCPVALTAPVSVLNALKPEVQEASESTSVVYYLPAEVSQDSDFTFIPAENQSGTDSVQAGESEHPHLDLMMAASYVWITGSGIMILYSVIQYIRLRGKLVGAMAYRGNVYRADYIDTPFVMGIFSPKIYLPSDVPMNERKYIIAHERHHIRRCDHIIKLLAYFSLCIHWFNPLVWAAFILAGKDMEMSCDEAVIRKLGEDVRADYSASLLNLSTGHRMFAGTPLAFGEGNPTERVRNIARWKKPAFRVILTCIILCSVLAACLLTNPESPAFDTMTLEFFDRTMAHIEFHYSDDSATYQISEEFSVEIMKAGIWQEVTKLSEETAANEIVIVTAEDADHDAWSVLKWEDIYGRLPDGNYRIRKEITKIHDTGDSETTPIYIKFTIGGTAEEYITYSLEDITPTGANLYEHEKVDDSVALIYSEGLWLESLHDGQWGYMEPTEAVNAFLPQEKYYIHERHYPSSHIELDWSGLYGELPDGTYRIVKEITNTDPSVLRLCTIYEEFTIGETTS